eukprot:TRINITY_DN12691_c0_g1_i1.p1 TRINITY_DN12691_c0_g1~~TRINITY_DN12691_c0_g1_i1.p1  ORF type:complete len:101 (+),score=19.09 TRINITY_DN12691_c0_g1_i1:23-304(+)
MSSGQTLGVKAQRFRGHTSPHRNVKEKKTTSETVGDKLQCREGNNPDHQQRPQKDRQGAKEVRGRRQSSGSLRSSYPLTSSQQFTVRAFLRRN